MKKLLILMLSCMAMTYHKSDATFLTEAVKNKNVTGEYGVNALLKKHHDIINTPDELGKTPLHYAVEGGRKDIVEILLSKPEIKINKRDNIGNTPLHYAVEGGAKGGRLAIVKLLLEHPDIKIDKPNKLGLTPLHRALAKAAEEIVVELVLHGADVDQEANIPEMGIYIKPRDYQVVKETLKYMHQMGINK